MPEELKDNVREISGKCMPTQKSSVVEPGVAGSTEQRKIKTNRIPKPAPREPEETVSATAEAPISSETISLKSFTVSENEAAAPEKRPLKITCYHCAQKLDLTDMVPFEKVKCPSCNVEIIVPKWFDNYLLEEPGGVGGMAFVYRALDLTLDREVAIKVLNPDVASQNERCHLFLHEARTAATINHYAVLPIYTCGEFEKQPYIVMQYMDGGSLDKKLEENKEPLPVNDVVKWIRDIAEGLDNARRHGIIHHDIKPANIMMDKDGNVKIGDFGISQALRDSRSESIAKITKTWASPYFVSPEKVLYGKEDHTGDVYSLGASFYQLLTGHTPFEMDDLERLVRIRTEMDPPPPKTHRPDISQAVSDLVMKMLCRNPEARPTYRDIVNALNAYMKEDEKRRGLADKKGKTSKKSAEISGGMRKFSAGNRSDYTRSAPRGNIIKTILTHIVFSAVFILAAFLLWHYGMFDKFLYKGGKLPPDLVAEATGMFRIGDCGQAGKTAEKILDDGTAKIAARKQAAIQMAFSKYLSNDPDAKTSCAGIYEKLVAANVPEDDSCLEILRYLGGSSKSTRELDERVELEGNKYFAVLAAHAVYIRSVYEKDSGVQIMNHSNKYLSLVSKLPPGEFWGAAWSKRVPVWKEWTEFGKGNPSKLEQSIADYKTEIKEAKPEVRPVPKPSLKREAVKSNDKPQAGSNAPVTAATPLIREPVKADDKPAVASEIVETDATVPAGPIKAAEDETGVAEELKKLNLGDLNADWLKAHREFASGRPRPADYNFSQDAFTAYQGIIPEDKRISEDERFKQVSGVKNYIVMLMERNPYDKPLKMKNGRTVSGGMMVNLKFISIRGKSGKHERFGWDSVPADQIAKMLEHFANIRLKASGGASVSKDQQRLEVAEDLLRIGVFCDWYGDYASAVKYARKAVETDPKISDRVRECMMQ